MAKRCRYVPNPSWRRGAGGPATGHRPETPESGFSPSAPRTMRRACTHLSVVGLAVLALAAGEAGETKSVKLSEEEARLLDLTNLERKKKELAPLKLHPALV